ncbi:related to TFG1 - TFIIF subunit (transcription initiation factor), 105 kD [Melanopsichium pennsylvanicum]|uniref:Related to TFG1 - TFIIF subunit (Transcription initiation factor), 105 kD n=2 Tax=Melanopsichium pennsylvanicum TaxID=63383 RepID=A0AAJ5C5Y6_9BASI|nr:related to TFG1-TFIIF subunit (transcription initiation factor) [Melanopsichium pennsylvanicum 4]SNX85033.1 related to TFG1 - TFIIF subunit (transcription initiation factor), 105 kD [Melanopsichium pennsylvanicum]
MPLVKSEPLAVTNLKLENGTHNTIRPRPANANARSALKPENDNKDLPSPPPPTTYRDIPLLSTDCGPWLTHLMKFAHHTRVDPNDTTQFIPPIKLNRKNPPRLKLPRPKPGDPITDKYNRPMMGKDGQPLTWPGPDDDLQRIEDVIKKDVAAKGAGVDQSLIAPGASARPPKSKLFKKKVREIHKAVDSARRTMKQEHFPWVLEDFETQEEWESIRTPIPTGARALQDHIDELKGKQNGASSSNTHATGHVKMQDSKSAVKTEGGVKQESGAVASCSSSSTSHAPWIGKLEGDDSSEASSLHVLFVFDERDAGGFKVVPVSRMYKFLQKPKHSTMTNEQVEQEYQKYQKTKEMDRWALRNKPVAAASSVTKQEDSAAWRSWPQVNQLSLPTGVSYGAGRRRNLMAVHGGELLRDNDDDDDDGRGPRRRKREDSPNAGYDELAFEEEFADDEETHDPEADVADDEEAKELEERLKREMARANNVGDEEEAEDASAPEDEDQILTGSGKQMMKIMRALAKREGNEAYEKDDDERNPYATDESDEDEEESYVANPEKAIQMAREEREKKEKEAAKINKPGKSTPGTGTGTASGSNTPTDRQEKKAVALGSIQTQQRPGAGHASLAQRATKPTRGASKIGSKQVSRSSSPSGARSTSPGRAESPPVASEAFCATSGLKRRADSPATPSSSGAGVSSSGAGSNRSEAKRVKTGSSGSRAGSPGGSGPNSKQGSRGASPGAPRVAANAVEAEIIQLIRDGKIANTSELVQHFRKRLKSEPHIKDQLSAAVRKVAVMDKSTNRLKLKDGF